MALLCEPSVLASFLNLSPNEEQFRPSRVVFRKDVLSNVSNAITHHPSTSRVKWMDGLFSFLSYVARPRVPRRAFTTTLVAPRTEENRIFYFSRALSSETYQKYNPMLVTFPSLCATADKLLCTQPRVSHSAVFSIIKMTTRPVLNAAVPFLVSLSCRSLENL